jgi:hypothetical protein
MSNSTIEKPKKTGEKWFYSKESFLAAVSSSFAKLGHIIWLSDREESRMFQFASVDGDIIVIYTTNPYNRSGWNATVLTDADIIKLEDYLNPKD